MASSLVSACSECLFPFSFYLSHRPDSGAPAFVVVFLFVQGEICKDWLVESLAVGKARPVMLPAVLTELLRPSELGW